MSEGRLERVNFGLADGRRKEAASREVLHIADFDKAGMDVEERFKDVATQIAPRVFRYRRQDLPDRAEVANLAEEAIYKSNKALRGQACDNLAGYVFRVFRRDANEYIKRGKRSSGQDEAFWARQRSRSATEGSPEQIEALILVREALDSMDPETRWICWRKYMREQSWESIAQDLSVPVGTVAARVHRALSKLRVALAGGQRRTP